MLCFSAFVTCVKLRESYVSFRMLIKLPVAPHCIIFSVFFKLFFISFLLGFDVVFVFIGFYSYISFYWFCNCIRFYFHFFSYYFVS